MIIIFNYTFFDKNLETMPSVKLQIFKLPK